MHISEILSRSQHQHEQTDLQVSHFTGPDGIRDHQASVLDPNTYVGIGTMSPEGTSDLNYLWRPSKVYNL